MRQVMVRYTVRPGRAEENEKLVSAVFDELRRSAPSGIHYATFQLEDGVSFVHLASIDGDHNPLSDLGAFADFQREIGERCEAPPVVAELREVGSFRFFDE